MQAKRHVSATPARLCMVELCVVCAAKRDGRAAPRRKCTCESGLTEHRERKPAPPKPFRRLRDFVKNEEGQMIRNPTSTHFDFDYTSRLVDRLKYYDNSDEATAFLDFREKLDALYESCLDSCTTRDRFSTDERLVATHALLSVPALVDFEADFALTLAEAYRNILSMAISSGEIGLVEFWMNYAGLDVESQCETIFANPNGACVSGCFGEHVVA